MIEDNFDAQFDQVSDDDFEQLLNNAPPTNTASAGSFPGTTPKDDPNEDTEDDEQEDKEKAKGKSKNKPSKSKEEIEIEDKNALDDITKDEDTDTSNKDKVTSVENKQDEDLSNIFKAKAKGLIDRGIWQDFDGFEDYEWSDESYGELAVQQAQWKAEETFDELVDQSGNYGKAILGHIKNGGDPSEIIDLFKESKRIEAIDITSQDNQEKILRDYYTKTMKWSEAKTTRFINAAIDDNSISDEAKEVKVLIEESIKEQVADSLREQEEFVAKQKEAVTKFENNIKSTLKTRKDLSDKERREIEGSLLSYDQKLPDGRKVNSFTIDFMKLQADPERYIDLVRFVKNPDKYIQQIAKEESSKAAKKTWEFVKGNASLSREGTSTKHTDNKKTKQEDLKIDYKQFI